MAEIQREMRLFNCLMIQPENEQPQSKDDQAYPYGDKQVPQDGPFGFNTCFNQSSAFALPCYSKDEE